MEEAGVGVGDVEGGGGDGEQGLPAIVITIYNNYLVLATLQNNTNGQTGE